MTLSLPLGSILVLPTIYLLWRAAGRDSKKIGADGLDDWFKAWVYVAVLWAAFYIGKLAS